MHVGTVAAGRSGVAVLERLQPFGVHLHDYQRRQLLLGLERQFGLKFHPAIVDLVGMYDVVTINAPLHPGTHHMFDEALLK